MAKLISLHLLQASNGWPYHYMGGKKRGKNTQVDSLLQVRAIISV